MSFVTLTIMQVYRAKQYTSKEIENYMLSKPHAFS